MGAGLGMRGLATPIDAGGYNPPPGNTDYAFEVSSHLAIHETALMDDRWQHQTSDLEWEQLEKSAWISPT
jgi:hypothetical protein